MVISCIIPAGRSTGDINGDGDITEADIQMIKDHNSGTTPITDETAVRCAVMNTNGKVDPGTIAGYNLYATGEAEYRYYTGLFINSVTVESVSLEDVLGNWEFQMFSRLTAGGVLLPDVIGEESKVRGGDFYIDIPIDGVTETSDVCLMFGKQPEYYNFRAKAYDGYVRIATVTPPVEEVSCTIVHKLNGNGNISVYYPSTILEEKDPTVPEWAKQPQKPEYTADEVGALPVDTSIPTKVSELENDKKYLTEHQDLSGYATENWVEGKGYLTQHQDLSAYAKKTEIPSSGVVLFEGGINPNTGKVITGQEVITLSDSAANYDVFEIYYVSNDTHWSYTKVYDPNGKDVMLLGALVGNTDIFLKLKCIRISDTNIIVASGSDTTKFFAGEGALIGGTLTRDKKFITITKVVGYPKT
jgi:hypothetical protein